MPELEVLSLDIKLEELLNAVQGLLVPKMREGAADSIEEVLKAVGYDALDDEGLSPPPKPIAAR